MTSTLNHPVRQAPDAAGDEPSPKVAVVIPCYRVAAHILDVVGAIPPGVHRIYCVDDACPEQSGKIVEANVTDPRVTVLYNEKNLGVGGAVKAGYRAALSDRCTIALKVDGDDQMDASLIPHFVRAIDSGSCDYAKGNRFFRIEDVQRMPKVRLIGNAALSFMAKASTGYWNIFDPTNGFTALHLGTLKLVDLDKIADRFFFETDLLFRLNLARCVVRDIPIQARYGDESSNLKIGKVISHFAMGHVKNTFKRLFYTYFLRDFHVASLMILFGPPILFAGILFGGYYWWLSATQGIPATAGTVMIAALLILVGAQLIFSALSFDMSNVPKQALHPTLIDGDETD